MRNIETMKHRDAASSQNYKLATPGLCQYMHLYIMWLPVHAPLNLCRTSYPRLKTCKEQERYNQQCYQLKLINNGESYIKIISI